MDARIMHINGYSYQFGHPRTADGYYFSHALCPWGWATWQPRCFCWVGDVVAALVRLADHPDVVGHVFNIGNDEEVTIRELATRVRAMTGSRSPIEFIDYARAYEDGFEDMPRRVPDLTKIGRLIDYRPTLDLDSILGRVIEHERSR